MPNSLNDKILCVDDEVNILHMFTRTLGRRHQVITAQSGEEALDLLQEHRNVAVIVSDYNMPGLNGIEFLKRARVLSPDSVQIILTGNAEFDVSIKVVNETDVFRYLPKPCPREILQKVILDALEYYRLLLDKKRLSEELEIKNRELAASIAELNKQKYLLEQELEMARGVYARVVSHDPEKLDGLDYLVSAKEGVGGDFLLTHTGSDKKTFYLMMGDLTGHGLQSALAVLLVAEGFRQYCLEQPSIDRLAALINDKMRRKLPTGLFCAALLVKLDIETQRMHIWQGGMPDVYLLDSQGRIITTLCSDNLPLGIVAYDDSITKTRCHTVDEVTALICCSDGVTEQCDDKQLHFGVDRLIAAISDSPLDSKRIDFIMTRLRHYQQRQPQSDDISLLELNLLRIGKALERI